MKTWKNRPQKLPNQPKSCQNLNSCSIKISHRGTSLWWLWKRACTHKSLERSNMYIAQWIDFLQIQGDFFLKYRVTNLEIIWSANLKLIFISIYVIQHVPLVHFDSTSNFDYIWKLVRNVCKHFCGVSWYHHLPWARLQSLLPIQNMKQPLCLQSYDACTNLV